MSGSWDAMIARELEQQSALISEVPGIVPSPSVPPVDVSSQTGIAALRGGRGLSDARQPADEQP